MNKIWSTLLPEKTVIIYKTTDLPFGLHALQWPLLVMEISILTLLEVKSPQSWSLYGVHLSFLCSSWLLQMFSNTLKLRDKLFYTSSKDEQLEGAFSGLCSSTILRRNITYTNLPSTSSLTRNQPLWKCWNSPHKSWIRSMKSKTTWRLKIYLRILPCWSIK